MIFNINDYKGKYVMHCKTKEEAKDFCEYLHNAGRRWCNKDTYIKDTGWDNYTEDIAYYFNEGLKSSSDYAKKENYTILEWSDFMYQNFTKADLKTGDIIQRRNGEAEIVNRELKMFITTDGWNDFRGINDDLTAAYGSDDEWDIVAVRRPKYNFECQFNAFECEHGTLVYERKEVEEMTLAEVCRLLGKEIKIVK